MQSMSGDSVQPHLVLFFDVNQTVILEDKAGGKTLLEAVNCSLADTAYGRVDAAHGSWVLDPVAPLRGGPGKTTYYHHLDSTTERATKRALTRICTAPDQPCAALAAERDAILAHLRDSFVLPSFYAVLHRLALTGRRISIVFRTFGDDLPKLLADFNAHVERHAHLRSFAVPPANVGLLHRFDRSPSGTVLLQPVRADSRAQLQRDPSLASLTGLEQITRFFAQLQPGRAYAYQDHYDFWASNAEARHSGKVFVIDPTDLTRHTIFFDDNLWPASVGDARGICDVRSLACLDAPLHYDDANGLWFHHVSPFLASSHEDYYVVALQSCESLRRHWSRIERATRVIVKHFWAWLDAHAEHFVAGEKWRAWALSQCCANAGHRCCGVCVAAWLEDGPVRRDAKGNVADVESLRRLLELLHLWRGVEAGSIVDAADVQRGDAPVWVTIGAAVSAKWPRLCNEECCG